MSSLRVLFLKERMAWPRASGHDVHTFYLMQALAARGHATALATIDAPPAEAVADSGTERDYCFADTGLNGASFPLRLTPKQEKFRNYWGVNEDRVRWLAAAAADFRADAVVVSGLNVLPYLGALPPETVKVWYAADEWVWHHLSQVRLFGKSTWAEIKPAVVKGLYERAYRKLLDRVWVVTEADAKAFRWVTGRGHFDVMPNGVDAEHYAPGKEPVKPNSCVFWGRLDFGPNVQAVEWFCTKVWPLVRAAVPDATFQIYGFQPTPAVLKFAGRDGVTVTADLPDLRPHVRGHMAAVMPFVSGGGIKNKLLEAAALGLPVLASKRVFEGLNGTPPLTAVDKPAEWVTALVRLWTQPAQKAAAGSANRRWVVEHHTWAAAARVAERGLFASRRTAAPEPEPAAK